MYVTILSHDSEQTTIAAVSDISQEAATQAAYAAWRAKYGASYDEIDADIEQGNIALEEATQVVSLMRGAS